MNKSDLIEALGKETGLTKGKAEQFVDGDRVEIRGLCSFFVKEYKGYTGRNPKSGAHTQVLPKKLPFFKCGKELKERVDYK